MKIRYELIIYWSNEEQLFIVEVPELAGCMADGETYQEAVQNAEIIIQQWIETAQELGLFSALCDNFCLWNLEMLTGQDF